MKRRKRNKKQGGFGRVLAIVLAVLLTIGACGLVYTLFKKHSEKWAVADVEYNSIFGENFATEHPVSELTLTDNMDVAPYAYKDTTLFSGKRITKISAPVATVTTVDENQYFTLWVIPSDVVKVGGKVDESTADLFKVYLPKEELTNTTVNKWITVDLSDQYVYVGENETLAFMKSDDPVKCVYSSTGAIQFYYGFMSSGAQLQSSQSIYYSVWGEDVVDLDGKTISVLGDSISTFTGISNDTTVNTTIGSNAVYYGGSNAGITSADQTWWKQAVDSTGAKLLVNNSWSGSKVYNGGGAAYDERCVQLHSDTGANKGTNPDIIAVYIGINDFNGKVELGNFKDLADVYDSETKKYEEPENFSEAYAIMLHKMTTKYDKADIYVFTLPANGTRVDEVALNEYNQNIRFIADYFDCKVVDLAGIKGYSYEKYCSDSGHLHPNQQGMDVITDLFVRALKGTYGDKEAK